MIKSLLVAALTLGPNIQLMPEKSAIDERPGVVVIYRCKSDPPGVVRQKYSEANMREGDASIEIIRLHLMAAAQFDCQFNP